MFSRWCARRKGLQLVLMEEADTLRLQIVQDKELLEEKILPRELSWTEQLEQIKKFVEDSSLSPQGLKVLLDSENVVQLLISLPLAKPKEVAKMLPWELMGYLAGKIEDYAYSYLIVERNDEGQQLLVQALPKTELAVWQERGRALQLPLIFCRGQLNLATWPQGLPLPEQLEQLNLCSPSEWKLSWQCLPCCQVLAAVLVFCTLSTWGCLQYQASRLEQRTVELQQELKELEPWPQRYEACLQREEQLQNLGRQLQHLEKQTRWSDFLRELGPALPKDTWLQGIHQLGEGKKLELVGQTLTGQEANQLVKALEALPRVQQARLLSTEAKGPVISYRILLEVQP